MERATSLILLHDPGHSLDEQSFASSSATRKPMAKTARVIGEALLAKGRFDLTRTEIEVVEDDGVTRRLSHEVYRHGKAAAVLLYDPDRSVVTLVKQFRAGAYLSDGALATIEVCAGMLDGNEPEACAVREAHEERAFRSTGPGASSTPT